jgi:hypothetical protein
LRLCEKKPPPKILPYFRAKIKTTMKRLLAIPLILILTACSEQSLQRTLETVNQVLDTDTPLTSGEVASGLREALVVGTGKAVDFAGVTDGFYKNPALFIPFPEEAEKIKSTAMTLGLGSQVTKFEETLNRAAEEAVKEAKPIFVKAITSMSIEDAFALLKGGDNAATNYLRSKTTAELNAAFQPKVENAVDQVELTKFWDPLAKAYNTATTFTGGEAINPDLTRYVTENAIEGLFTLIATEEANIRENPAARVNDLLQRVFGSDEAKN